MSDGVCLGVKVNILTGARGGLYGEGEAELEGEGGPSREQKIASSWHRGLTSPSKPISQVSSVI